MLCRDPKMAVAAKKSLWWRRIKTVSYALLLWIASALIVFAVPDESPALLPAPVGVVAWAMAQWMPSFFFVGTIAQDLQSKGWKSFERSGDSVSKDHHIPPLEIPVIDLEDPSVIGDPLAYLERRYGVDWRERPLLLKNLWSASALNDSRRRLSLEGLSKENMTIPYFSDARLYSALTPDAQAPIHEILRGMRDEGRPYKIGSQLFLQANPALLAEVAPVDVVTKLFGDRFTKDRLLGHIQSPLNFLRGPLTVPLFVANGNLDDEIATCQAAAKEESDSSSCESDPTIAKSDTKSSRPFTGLHCEPIGNVAVNLAGTRQWTLVEPQYSYMLRPAVSPDSRGFFASWAPSIQHVPRYEAIKTLPGDALWVPTWTWHRVDYVTDERADSSVAMGASLFHFRPIDFIRRNPIYAVILLPYLVGEFIGSKSQ